MVQTRTSNKYYSQSVADIYYTLTGTDGKTSEYKADLDDDNTRERGEIDKWHFADSVNIGRFQCLKFRLVGDDNWRIDAVIKVFTKYKPLLY